MPERAWSLLVDAPQPGWSNMATDAALLDLAEADNRGVLRLYRWEPHCLSFGRHEPALRRYDVERIRADGIDCVRRPTGGRAVWHARELTYSVTAPIAWFGTLRDAYAEVHEVIVVAIQRLGATAALAPRSVPTPSVGSGPCFASPVGGEVLMEGFKVAGSAQLRQGSGFLQHGSLLLEDDQLLVHGLAGLSGEGADAPLSRLMDRPVEFDEVAEALAAAAEDRWGTPQRLGSLPERARRRADTHALRFRSPEWTWLR